MSTSRNTFQYSESASLDRFEMFHSDDDEMTGAPDVHGTFHHDRSAHGAARRDGTHQAAYSLPHQQQWYNDTEIDANDDEMTAGGEENESEYDSQEEMADNHKHHETALESHEGSGENDGAQDVVDLALNKEEEYEEKIQKAATLIKEMTNIKDKIEFARVRK
jgi:hypothetical protein